MSADDPAATARLIDEYLARAGSDDPVERAVALHQLERLRLRSSNRPQLSHPCSEDGSSPGLLPRLIEQAVGPVSERPNGALESPCPWHSSRSGRCLLVFADGERWSCRSCKRGGDVVTWVALTTGVSFPEARRRLGLPAVVRRPRSRLEVVRHVR